MRCMTLEGFQPLGHLGLEHHNRDGDVGPFLSPSWRQQLVVCVDNDQTNGTRRLHDPRLFKKWRSSTHDGHDLSLD